jgi:transposase
MDGQYAGSRQWVGVDLHRFRSVVVRIDEWGQRVGGERVSNAEPGALLAAVARAGRGAPVAIEACNGWYWPVDELIDAGHPVTLVHPAGMGSTWEQRKVKNDFRDAEELARRLQRGDLPVAWICPPPVRQLRELVRYRHKLVGQRTACKAQVHAVLAKQGLFPSVTDVFGRRGRALLDAAPLDGAYRIRVDLLVDTVDHLDVTVAKLDTQIARMITATPAFEQALARARTLPGVGPVLGSVLIAEIGDIARFASPNQLTSWAGMTPWHRESDLKAHRGRITKQGNRLVRWAAVEAVQKHTDPNTPMSAVKRRILARRGRPGMNIAKVAAARELLDCLFYALRDGYCTRLVDVRTGQVAVS